MNRLNPEHRHSALGRAELFPKAPTAKDSEWFRQVVEGGLSAIALVTLSPLLLLVAGCIWTESGWPILFVQNRVGRYGKEFRLYKFRTMLHSTEGRPLTVRGDHRVTHVGAFLRKFKLDELPQLWNVVRGDMALVGPRPEIPEFVNLADPMWRSVLAARPGITHPASIAFHNEEELLAQSSDPIRYYQNTLLPAKLAMHIDYLRTRSIWGDVQVIFRTALCSLFPDTFSESPNHAAHTPDVARKSK